MKSFNRAKWLCIIHVVSLSWWDQAYVLVVVTKMQILPFSVNWQALSIFESGKELSINSERSVLQNLFSFDLSKDHWIFWKYVWCSCILPGNGGSSYWLYYRFSNQLMLQYQNINMEEVSSNMAGAYFIRYQTE